MALREILRTGDMGKVAIIESLLSSENILHHFADRTFKPYGSPGFEARLLIAEEDFERALEMLIEAGFKTDIFPMRKTTVPK